MACPGNGTVCQRCLVAKMKMVPAEYLTQSVRTGLSQILDPVRSLPDNDYKFFAERNGLTPLKVDWLDSKRTRDYASSINLVLDYLIQRDRAQFTVYKVYKTLCDMNSDGQRIICNGMAGIWRLFNQGSRQGQEDSEPPSLNPAHQVPQISQGMNNGPSHFTERSCSPPPPYCNTPSPQSNYLTGGDGAVPLNNLNAGYSPVGTLDTYCNGSPTSGSHPQGKLEGGVRMGVCDSDRNSHRQPGRMDACENSFPADMHPTESASNHQCSRSAACEDLYYVEHYPHQNVVHENFQPARHEAAENSCCSDGTGHAPSSAPPSYMDSQSHYRRTGNPTRMTPQSPTDMEDLKLPLEGPEVVAEGSAGPVSEWNSRPGSSPGPSQDENSRATLPLLSPFNRPISFPASQTSSYKKQQSSTRPFSDAMYCSHSGACNCSVGQWSFVTPSLVSSMHDSSFAVSCRNHQHASSDSVSVAVSEVSANSMPWNDGHHQTEVKQPLGGKSSVSKHSGCGRNSVSQHSQLPANLPSSSAPPQHFSLPATRREDANIFGRNGLSSRFVFVVAADSDENENLHQQVKAFCQQLQTRGIGYVVVCSMRQWPIVNLPDQVLDCLPPQPTDFKSVQKFVWGCYKKAAKVLMLITPGYLRYADAYTEDAEEPKTFQQKLMRKIQERLKEEFFNRTVKFRIWPVILHEMKANRVHLPSFLSGCVFYWFPFLQGAENVMEVLHKDLGTRSSSVKRSI